MASPRLQQSGGTGGKKTPVFQAQCSESEGFSTDEDLAGPAVVLRRRSFRQSATDDQSQQHRPTEIVKAVFEYSAQREDELSLKRGSTIEVISKDSKISGDEGWWTGKLENRVGVFPSNFVQTDVQTALQTYRNFQETEPRKIQFSELKLGQVIGAGGFGKVYHGYWAGHEVAVKATRIESEHQSEGMEAVRQEGRLFNLLKHTNIVSLLGVCLDMPHPCLVLEYCAGGSLNRVLYGQKIPAEILLDWAVQIAQGMHYLHELAPVSLVHRDLKSSNGN